MKRFLVGGAVRDELLRSELRIDRPTGDRDWVVVGATEAQMLAAGYRRVGAGFPVYLHPRTHEEHALARDADGGFSAEVSLEDDLGRRDLSINALARSAEGELVDPCGGLNDLRAGLLRHINDHFDDDPLRVLRVARFAAQLPGFQVAPETLARMRRLADLGALDRLTPERVFNELRKALRAPAPDHFVRVLRECGALARTLPEVDALFGVPQPARYHPEIDTGEHLCLALAMSARLAPGDDQVGYAVLLHDLGKGVTPREQWPSHRGHEASGKPLVRAVGRRLRVPGEFDRLAQLVCEFHLHMHRLHELRPKTVLKLLEDIGAFRKPERVDAFGLACMADALGRTGMEERPYPALRQLRALYQAAASVSSSDLLAQGAEPGPQLGERLRRARIAAIKAVQAGDATPARWPDR